MAKKNKADEIEKEVCVQPEQQVSECAELEQKLKDKEDMYLRILAEYDNFRKRTAKEREGIYSDARAEVVIAFLPVLDNMERAVAQQSSDDEYKKGTELILRQLLDVLTKYNVKAVGEVGEVFDPNLHNAVMHVEDESLDENVIAEVFMKGYMMNDKVIRHAMVKAAN